MELLISVSSVGFIYFHSIVVASSYRISVTFSTVLYTCDVVLKYNLHYRDPVLGILLAQGGVFRLEAGRGVERDVFTEVVQQPVLRL